jgi:hypothetical protein
MKRVSLGWVLAASLAWGAGLGCNGPDAQTCRFNADCVEPREYCDAATSRCAQFECIEDGDCATGERCNTIARVCIADDLPDADAGDPDSGGGGEDADTPACPPGQVEAAVTGQGLGCWRTCTVPSDCPLDEQCEVHSGESVCVPGEQTNNGDTTPPTVTSVTPDPSAGTLTPDASFAIAFSEPMDPISISEFSVILEDLQGTQVPLSIAYDEQTQVATATPRSPLASATRYELTVNTFARDAARNFMAADQTFVYYTAFEESAEAAALALKWAPLVYQELHSVGGLEWRYDVPSRVDFDGDIVASNNKANALTAPNYKAHVYYHVTRSTTQTFIYYVMYYPTRALVSSDSGNRVQYEHDMTGAVFVVDEASDELLLVEGMRLEDGQDILISYLRGGSGVDIPGAERVKGTFSAGDLEGGTRYRMYVPAGRHEACYWRDDQPRPPLDICRHPSGGYTNQGVLLRPGAAQGYDEATQGPDGPQIEYGLEPLAQLFWLRRDSYGAQGLFERGFTYRPDGDRPAGPDEDTRLVLPNRLNSSDAETFGDSPFQWLVQGTDNNPGQWLIDPAWTLPRRYSFPQRVTWSQEYCDNLFLSIDACP